VAGVTFAIGDVHGRFDLLQAAAKAIDEHPARKGARLVYLGDYVDRGPDSRGVIEFLMASQAEDRRIVCLKGNHEEMMLRAFKRSSRDLQLWLANGGVETLDSYASPEAPGSPASVPAEHLRWLEGLPLTSGDKHRIYVHAGLLPSKAVEDQDARTFLWIREKFLKAKARQFERHVVHGHTPLWAEKPDMAAPELLSHRTNLDTGAFATGVLTVAVFPEDRAGGPDELITVTASVKGPPSTSVRRLA
jgi:serine/threonine protein phosphatase 1